MGAIEKLIEAKEQRSSKVAALEQKKEGKDIAGLYAKLDEFAKGGYGSIPEEDREFFLKSFGIFDRPATPERFMIRVRVPGGALNATQAEAIANAAIKYGKDYIDITTRMQIELRYLAIEDIPTLLRGLESVGITTYQTGIDNFRNILADPLCANAKDSVIDTTPAIEGMQDIFLKNPEWISTLPRKFNTGISGSSTNRCNIFGQDCAFVLAKKGDEHGFNLYLGGKVGVKAESADMFVRVSEVSTVFGAIISLFKKYGFRDNRNKNRLKFLLDAVGMDNFTAAIKEAAGVDFESAGELLNDSENFESKIPIGLKDGTFAVHCAVPSGVFSGSDLLSIAALAKEHGNGELRFTVEQNMYILGVKEPSKLPDTDIVKKYITYENGFLTNLVACAGTEHCPFGVIANKPDAIELAEYLHKSVKYTKPVRMYWSACPKGCGIHACGDIGFVGTKKAVDGKVELAVDIYMGGKLSGEGEEGRLYQKGVLLKDLKETVANLPIFE